MFSVGDRADSRNFRRGGCCGRFTSRDGRRNHSCVNKSIGPQRQTFAVIQDGIEIRQLLGRTTPIDGRLNSIEAINVSYAVDPIGNASKVKLHCLPR